MTTPFLERIDAVLVEGRATAELARQFLAVNERARRGAPGDDPLPGLLRLASERIELSTGYRYLFENEPGLVGRIADVLEHERRSGRFVRFQMGLRADGGPVTLDVSGPGDVRAFLAALDAPDRKKATDFARKLAGERGRAWISKAGSSD